MLKPLSRDAFNALVQQGYNRIPLALETFADLDTPLSLYLKLADQPYSYLLESVEGGERFGRYSVIGLPCQQRLVVRGKNVAILSGEACLEQHDTLDPLAFIHAYHARLKAPHLAGMPRFAGGLAGYFGYETVCAIEPRLQEHSLPDSLNLPDILLMLSEQIAVMDNVSGRLFLIVYADASQEQAYDKAIGHLNALVAKLRQSVVIPKASSSMVSPATSEWGEQAFKAGVQRIHDYILAGDVMQVVLSQRMAKPFTAPPLSLYRALRSLNPSPYLFYYHMADHHLIGASPEILVRMENDTVTVRPIAGTRPRGNTAIQDAQLADELLADSKECAEHVQLIDLGRNDVGKIAQTGSVQVTENMQIERYSHVMHMVSNVVGKLKPDLHAIDVLRATFPAGTVSGAPKIRAMEIIAELEPSKRGIYAGAVGHWGFNGNLDLAIAIRTGVIKDHKLYVQAGAGIVADSIPDNEWAETQNKARAVLRAAEWVEEGLDSDG